MSDEKREEEEPATGTKTHVSNRNKKFRNLFTELCLSVLNLYACYTGPSVCTVARRRAWAIACVYSQAGSGLHARWMCVL